MAILNNSSFLQLTSWNSVPSTDSVQDAYGFSSSQTFPFVGTEPILNVALILPRADAAAAAAFTAGTWAERQQTIQTLGDDIWSTFGADAAQYQSAVDTLNTMGIPILDASDGYVTSQDARTIWVSLTAAQFNSLFSTTVYFYNGGADAFFYYNGQLTLPDSIAATELMLDYWVYPATDNMASDPVALEQGPQSEGNSSAIVTWETPQAIAGNYNFPLTGNAAVTGTLGLIEPGIGSAMPTGDPSTFSQALTSYLTSIGINTTPTLYTVADGGQSAPEGNGERSLDVGIAAAVNPYSTIGFYAGSGNAGNAVSTTFTAYQSAIWDLVYNPSVLSSSWQQGILSAPGSPFYYAYQDLFLDAAIRNISMFIAAGDGGSGAEVPDGLANLQYANMNPYSVLVGGTSLSTVTAAQADASLASLVASVGTGTLSTIWSLVSGGLTSSPSSLTGSDIFVETVWNQYHLRNDILNFGYYENASGAGGVDTRGGIPNYQADYGLTPTGVGPSTGVGRGVPDVSANSAGNMEYIVPNAEMDGPSVSGGTSAATPLWATLGLQLNTIFQDQGLPQLGYMNDLLYIASAIAPGSFNDVTIGNNISSFIAGGPITTYDDGTYFITPTGFGYEAAQGYDLTSGLGTPNGTLLARALTAIAHSQMYFSDVPDVLIAGAGDFVSGASQSLLFQPIFASDEAWALDIGGSALSFSSVRSAPYAWTNQFAQQSLQADFSADLVTMFDTFGQGSLYQTDVAAGASLAIAIAGQDTSQPQITMTSAFGFADFVSSSTDSAIQVARPVAIAETAGGLDDQDVVVRMRQNGMNESSVTFYKVDDFNGDIEGLSPGDPGYAAAVAARAYHTDTGATAIQGQGYGQYSQTELVGVDAGDLIAMVLSSGGHTYYAFAQANEKVDGQSVGHIWNYGLNTWGFEDLYGGGDHDFNDIVVQLDFTSAAGSGYLI